ncbi:cytochrome P450 [Ascodesmis nigricans]|uniref:Cytochrome P450 n=1 Tax=Ascodesmis nigricans TaxID=341454 RepID=A0A4V3SHR0_9PEZI|nr:cytochrome P450 [Ascodesmis nigricans]
MTGGKWTFVRISHKEVSIDEPAAISPWYEIFSLPDSSYPNQMSECDHIRHMHKTKNLSGGFTLTNLLRPEARIDSCISLLCSRLATLSTTQRTIPLYKWLHYLGFDVLGEMTFSESFGFLQEGRDIRHAIRITDELATYVAVMGYLPWVHKFLLGNPIIGLLGLRPNQHILDTAVSVQEARREKWDARLNILEQWNWRYHAVKGKGGMEKREIVGAALANIGAGVGAVNTVMQGLFYFLIRNKEWMEKVREEVDQAHREGRLSWPAVQYREAVGLRVVDACYKETLRLFPTIAFALLPIVPTKTTVSVNFWTLHRNTSIFGADAESYNPASWLTGTPETLRNREKFLMPFGVGYNSCPGQNVAVIEVLKTVVTLLRRFEFDQREPEKKENQWK